jgi:hypothetical protein
LDHDEVTWDGSKGEREEEDELEVLVVENH